MATAREMLSFIRAEGLQGRFDEYMKQEAERKRRNLKREAERKRHKAAAAERAERRKQFAEIRKSNPGACAW